VAFSLVALSKTTTCNPANIDDSCIYPDNYGEYGLLISYILSGKDAVERNAKTARFSGFLISLEEYTANKSANEAIQ